MPSILSKLVSKGLAHPPSGLENHIQYEVIMGSEAYAVSSDDSDRDIYGWCIPQKTLIFPHLAGEVEGFGSKGPRFEVYQQHHINDESTKKEYDFQIYSIVKYFNLLMGCNPNMVDSVFVPHRCILHMTPLGQLVRDNRHLFLQKRAWHTFKGYAYQQLHKIHLKNPKEGSKREALIKQFSYDVKFAYHIVRLMLEVEQILVEGDLDLERHREQLKSIRRGEWKLEDIEAFFKSKEKELEQIYVSSKLRHSPDEAEIKKLLLNCLEQHFGTLENCVVEENQLSKALNDIHSITEKLKSKSLI